MRPRHFNVIGQWTRRARTATALLLLSAAAHGQAPLLNTVHSIATASTGVPIEHDVTIPSAGKYDVLLTDLGAASTPPAPLASVALAVSYGDALVGTPIVGAGTLEFTAAVSGTYRLHVVGMPGGTPGSGPIGIQVTSSAGGAPIFSSSDNLALPAQAVPNSIGVLDDSFTVAASGNYQVALADLSVPQPLGGSLIALVVAPGSSTPVVTLPDNNALQETAQLQSGVNYRIFAIGQTGASANAGLYSAVVAPVLTGGSLGAAVYSRAVPVGGTTLLGNPVITSAGTHALTAADLKFPAALTQLAAALVLDGQVALALTKPGTTSFTASAGTYQAFGVATPGAGGAGSYALQLSPASGAPELSAAQAVSAPGGTSTAYTFNTQIATAGTYSVSLHDYQFPSAVLSGSIAAVQGTALVGTPLNTTGSFNINAASGQLTLIAFAQGGQGGSLIDVNVAGSGGSLVFDQPQGVGAAFGTEQFSVTTAGNYTVTAADLAFPAPFTELSVIVTQGNTLVGSIFGAGSLPPVAAKPGNYFVNILATPAGPNAATPATPSDAGTYAVNVAPGPAPPTVSLSADATSVTSGGTVHLIWTTQNATSCTESGGGWTGTLSGAQLASGSTTSPPITTNTTFTLSCTGPGGTASDYVSISVATASKSGGGTLGPRMLWLLGAALLVRLFTRVPLTLPVARHSSTNR